jgi:hypothetical protein
MSSVVGGCYCGAIRYEADGECTNTMVCHCQTCRRVAAAWVKFGDGLPAFQESRPRKA